MFDQTLVSTALNIRNITAASTDNVFAKKYFDNLAQMKAKQMFQRFFST